MGTFRFAGVVFQVYSDDHLPRHVHGRYADIVVIVEIWPGGSREAVRKDSVTPPNAKRSDVAHVLRAAQSQIEALNELWEATHDA